MTKKKIKITNETGIHARPASLLVQEANKFKADIKLVKGDQEINAKSIMGVMSLGITQGDEVSIKSESKEAVDAIVGLIESDFGE